MKKYLAMLLVLTMVLGLLAACGDSTSSAESVEESAAEESTQTEEASLATSQTAQQDSSSESSAEMPLANHDVTLGMWIELAPYLEGTSYTDPADFPFYQNLSQATGVDFEFTTVSMTAASEQFNLTVASQSFPDIICNPSYYSGSVDDAIENEVFLDVTDLLPEYAPDYLEVINRDNETRLAAYSMDGRVGVFYEIAKEAYPSNSGLVIRQDWLDELGMDVPVTYEELHDVLLAFKEEFGAESPIYTDSNSLFTELTSGYNFKEDFVNVDGTAVYSTSAEQFADYVEMMHQWYEEGLIYSDYYVYSENNTESDEVKTRLIDTNQVGVWYNWCEDLELYEVDDSDYALTAITNPVVNAGDEIHICSGVDPMLNTSGGWALSTNSDEEKVEIAIRLINYLYTEEGSLLANWGIEGETFTYQDDGTPHYTDLILNNEEFATNMSIGLYCVFRGPILSDLSRFNQNVQGELAEYCAVWGQQDNSYEMPNVSMDATDSERYNSLKSDIDTALSENLPEFIIGTRPIEELDTFMEELRSMGLDEMVELEQTALDQYNSR